MSTNDRSSAVAAGINLGYSLTWIIGYLANRFDLQQSGFEAIREVYDGEPPKPHEFDRVGYVKALHTVSGSIYSFLTSVSNLRTIKEGSRMFTPVRLGFPRQTLDGANYMGHNIPKDTVRFVSGCELQPHGKAKFAYSAYHHESIRSQPRSYRFRSTQRISP